MAEFKIRSVDFEDHVNDLKEEINKNGLFRSVKKRCDEIIEECQYMKYKQQRFIRDTLDDILLMINEVKCES